MGRGISSSRTGRGIAFWSRVICDLAKSGAGRGIWDAAFRGGVVVVLVIYMRYRLVFENAAPFSRRHFISTHFAKTGRGIFDEGTRQICRVLFEHKSISHVNDQHRPEMPPPKCRLLFLQNHPIRVILQKQEAAFGRRHFEFEETAFGDGKCRLLFLVRDGRRHFEAM